MTTNYFCSRIVYAVSHCITASGTRNVALIRKALAPANGLDALVLPASHKSMLSALTKAQARGVLQNDEETIGDTIGGKGTLIQLH